MLVVPILVFGAIFFCIAKHLELNLTSKEGECNFKSISKKPQARFVQKNAKECIFRAFFLQIYFILQKNFSERHFIQDGSTKILLHVFE